MNIEARGDGWHSYGNCEMTLYECGLKVYQHDDVVYMGAIFSYKGGNILCSPSPNIIRDMGTAAHGTGPGHGLIN